MNLDLALLVLRLAIGLTLAAHGAQKLFGWFGGHGLAGTTGWLASLRLKPAPLWAFAAASGEFFGGLLLALGLLTPLAGVAATATMVMAVVLAHWPRFWAASGGIEYALVLGAASAALALSGAGAYSLDAALGLAVPAGLSLAVAALAVLSVLAALASRGPAPVGNEAQAAD